MAFIAYPLAVPPQTANCRAVRAPESNGGLENCQFCDRMPDPGGQKPIGWSAASNEYSRPLLASRQRPFPGSPASYLRVGASGARGGDALAPADEGALSAVLPSEIDQINSPIGTDY
jgi:hypothetical protein